MNDLEQWEAVAEQFYKDTGYMRPGKDDACNLHSHEERAGAFRAWLTMKARNRRPAAFPDAESVVVPRELIKEVTDLLDCAYPEDDDECWFDHHGGCQAHGYISLKLGEQCPHAQAPGAIKKLQAALAGQVVTP